MISMQWKLWLWVGALSAAGLIGWRVYDGIYDKGVEDTLSEIEEINNELEDGAIDRREAVRRCRDAGGVPDFATGECGEPDESGG